MSSVGRGTELKGSVVSPHLESHPHPAVLSVEGFLLSRQGFHGGGWLGPRASAGTLVMACSAVRGPGWGASPIPSVWAPSRLCVLPPECSHPPGMREPITGAESQPPQASWAGPDWVCDSGTQGKWGVGG